MLVAVAFGQRVLSGILHLKLAAAALAGNRQPPAAGSSSSCSGEFYLIWGTKYSLLGVVVVVYIAIISIVVQKLGARNATHRG